MIGDCGQQPNACTSTLQRPSEIRSGVVAAPVLPMTEDFEADCGAFATTSAGSCPGVPRRSPCRSRGSSRSNATGDRGSDGEFVGSDRRLAYLRSVAGGDLRTELLFATLAALTAIGLVLHYVVALLERPLDPVALSRRGLLGVEGGL